MLAVVSVLFSFATIIAFAVLDGYNLKDDPAMRWLMTSLIACKCSPRRHPSPQVQFEGRSDDALAAMFPGDPHRASLMTSDCAPDCL